VAADIIDRMALRFEPPCAGGCAGCEAAAAGENAATRVGDLPRTDFVACACEAGAGGVLRLDARLSSDQLLHAVCEFARAPEDIEPGSRAQGTGDVRGSSGSLWSLTRVPSLPIASGLQGDALAAARAVTAASARHALDVALRRAVGRVVRWASEGRQLDRALSPSVGAGCMADASAGDAPSPYAQLAPSAATLLVVAQGGASGGARACVTVADMAAAADAARKRVMAGEETKEGSLGQVEEGIEAFACLLERGLQGMRAAQRGGS